MGIKLRALPLMGTVVRIHNRDHLVRVRRQTVVVFIPQHNDCVVATRPRRRFVDRRHQLLHRVVAQQNQRRVQASLRSVIIRIVVAKGS